MNIIHIRVEKEEKERRRRKEEGSLTYTNCSNVTYRVWRSFLNLPSLAKFLKLTKFGEVS